MAEQKDGTVQTLVHEVLNVGVGGKGPWKGSAHVADEHLRQHKDPEEAIKRLVATHVRMTAGSGFVSGLGGLMLLPVTIPVDFGTLWVAQGRLAGGIAHLRGYDVSSEEVRSVVMLSLLGASGAELLSKAGVQIGTKSAMRAVQKVPGRVLIEINKKVGYRLVTKAGAKGVVNLTKLVPFVGGVVGGGINATSTAAVGKWASNNFPTKEPFDDASAGNADFSAD